MNSELRELAEQFLSGAVEQREFLRAVAKTTLADTEQARVDLDRLQRAGYPEVVFGEGKTIEALESIVSRLKRADQQILVTRISSEQAESLLAKDPSFQYNPHARTLRSPREASLKGTVAVVTAGTSDLPVAEEAAETLIWMGCNVRRVADVGVAGPHRLPAHLEHFEGVQSVVVVAGMEGALPSVVAGYLSVPIVAVPTSVGYGANLNGIAALLSMLNSCAANVAVVNIDAGFKGGYLAGMIAQQTNSLT